MFSFLWAYKSIFFYSYKILFFSPNNNYMYVGIILNQNKDNIVLIKYCSVQHAIPYVYYMMIFNACHSIWTNTLKWKASCVISLSIILLDERIFFFLHKVALKDKIFNSWWEKLIICDVSGVVLKEFSFRTMQIWQVQFVKIIILNNKGPGMIQNEDLRKESFLVSTCQT